jgi:hypothetical protein
MKLEVAAVLASVKTVNSDGKEITMVSTAFNAPAIYREVISVKTAGDCVSSVQALYQRIVQANPLKTFTLLVRAIDRKCRGFDNIKGQLGLTHIEGTVE